MSALGDITPRSGPPKPLTKAELKKRQKAFRDATKTIDRVQKEEQRDKKKEKIDHPEWI
jgi:hypothetical protein